MLIIMKMFNLPFYGQIIPHREIRVKSNGTALFYGLIDDWNLEYQPNGDNRVIAVASDGFSLLATQNLSAHTATAELTGTRIETVLSRPEVNWPTTSRVIDEGQASLQADVVDEGINVLDYLQTVNQSEPGSIFIGTDGSCSFHDRTFPINSSDIVTFADDGTGTPFNNLSVVYGSEQLHNRVVVTRVNGTAQTSEDIDSQIQYGISTLEQSDLLLNTDSDALLLSEYLLSRYAEPEYRFDALEVELARLSTAQQNAVLGLELTQVVRIKFTPNNVGSPIDKYAQITGISHRTDSISHIVVLNLSTLDYANFVLNDTIFGVLDDDRLGF